MTSSGRNTGRRHREAQQSLKASSRARGASCWLCGQSIDYDADALDPNSFQLDHVMPVATHPHLEHEPTNHAASHRSCNNRRKTSAPAPSVGSASRDW